VKSPKKNVRSYVRLRRQGRALHREAKMEDEGVDSSVKAPVQGELDSYVFARMTSTGGELNQSN